MRVTADNYIILSSLVLQSSLDSLSRAGRAARAIASRRGRASISRSTGDAFRCSALRFLSLRGSSIVESRFPLSDRPLLDVWSLRLAAGRPSRSLFALRQAVKSRTEDIA